MDSLYSEIFGLQFRTSQVLAGAIFTVCLALYIYFLIKRPTKPFFFKEAPVVEGANSPESSVIEEDEEENFIDEEACSAVEAQDECVTIGDNLDLDESDSADEVFVPAEESSQDTVDEVENTEALDSEEATVDKDDESIESVEPEAVADEAILDEEVSENVADDASKVEENVSLEDETESDFDK